MNFIDRFLNSITMYRLVLGSLIFIALASLALSYLEKLGYAWSIFSMLFSVSTLLFSCYFSNLAFSKILKIPINTESSLITALILFLIMPVASSAKEILILALIGFISMASKYLISPFGKHIFNPAAFAAFFAHIFNFGAAIWWVGDPWLGSFVLFFGFLVVRKIRRFEMVGSFIGAWLVSLFFFGRTIFTSFQSFQIAIGPILFFATIMLTEPITTPPKRKLQIAYGVLSGFLLNVNFALWGLISTPEIVLMVGNVFSYLTSLKRRLVIALKEKKEIAKNIYEFVFVPSAEFSFESGQFLEWTLTQGKADSRGNRRYFTIASSPTEKFLKLGIKLNKSPSSFKKKLFKLKKGDKILAGQLGGDFVLPRDARKKLVFLAGGIGITPFRSMIKYLLDKGEKRDIILFYAVKTENEIAYRALFVEAQKKMKLKIKYTVGKSLSEESLRKEVSDYKERLFYISGPEDMVEAFSEMLLRIGISRMNIVKDYFPGFA